MGKLIMINKNQNLIKQNKGQIAIIVLLASAIILTLGLSVSKKTITETKITTDEESLKQVFNTAESAINNYLNTGVVNYTTEGSGATVVSSVVGNSSSLVSEGQILANSNQLFWLVNHDTDNNIGSGYYTGTSVDLKVNDGFNGSLKIDYFYKDAGGNFGVKRLGYNFGGNDLVTGFSANASTTVTLDLTAGSPLLLSIIPLGAPTGLTLSGSSNFPGQGEELIASGSTGSDVKTQIKTRYIYQAPSFLMDAITARNIIQ